MEYPTTMDAFKKIVVLGDRSTGKTYYVDTYKKPDAFVIDDADCVSITHKVNEFVADQHSQSILILQYPYDNQALIDNVDCVILFQMSEFVHEELQRVFGLPQIVMQKLKTLDSREYIIYDGIRHSINVNV